MEHLILYCLSVYCIYHVLGQSDIMARPRGWLTKVLPGWLTYPLGCSFCFCGWTGIFITAYIYISTRVLMINLDYLLAAPVFNLLVDRVIHGAAPSNPTNP